MVEPQAAEGAAIGTASVLARGWHPDPEDPRRERWHDGAAFTPHTHRALRKPSLFGGDYDRSMWTGANTAAARARRASDVASIAFAVSMVLVILIPFAPWAFTALGVGMLIIAVAATAQVVLGQRGIRRAPADGGLGMSIIVVAQGSIYLLIALAYLALRLTLSLGS